MIELTDRMTPAEFNAAFDTWFSGDSPRDHQHDGLDDRARAVDDQVHAMQYMVQQAVDTLRARIDMHQTRHASFSYRLTALIAAVMAAALIALAALWVHG